MKPFLFFVTLSLSAPAFAQSPVTANASLESVTVFSSGAEMNHKAKAALPAGNSEVLINNVANVLDENSIRIGAGSNVTIMSVSFTKDYLKEEAKTPAYLKAEDSLKAAGRVLSKLNAALSANQNTLALLEKNQNIGGANTGVNVAELEKMVAFNKAKHAELNNNIMELNEQVKEQQAVVARWERQLAEVSRDKSGTGGQLLVQVMVNNASASEFNITYMSPNAGWTAFYDLRAENTASDLKILYKANLVQNTGIDWKKVKLTLSTGNPSQSGTAPLLSAWFLRYGTPQYLNQSRYQNRIQSDQRAASGQLLEEVQITNGYAKNETEDKSLSDYTSQTENQLSATFDVEIPYDIASNDKPHSVSLKNIMYRCTINTMPCPRPIRMPSCLPKYQTMKN